MHTPLPLLLLDSAPVKTNFVRGRKQLFKIRRKINLGEGIGIGASSPLMQGGRFIAALGRLE